eukprot:88814-Rhodomonas_salina.3
MLDVLLLLPPTVLTSKHAPCDVQAAESEAEEDAAEVRSEEGQAAGANSPRRQAVRTETRKRPEHHDGGGLAGPRPPHPDVDRRGSAGG